MEVLPLRSLLFVTLALMLVLLMRRPARLLFGAGPAFGLWLLPVTALLLPYLPELPAHWFVLPAIRALPETIARIAVAPQTTGSTPWLPWLWLAGTTAMALRLVVHYLRLRRQSRPMPVAMTMHLRHDLAGLDPRRLRLHPAGPALLWAPRSLLLLPADFLERFDASERRMVLRHELTHLRRGDALWSLVAELAFALLWFHPLAWLARPCFRLDQELACDERVLRDAPRDEAGYAHTLLHSVGLAPMPALIPWFDRPQLKERLVMIQRQRPGAARRRAGYLVLAALLAASAFVVQAATKAQENQAPASDLAFNARITPHYPESAIRNKEQGTVVLKILVGKDGSPLTITIDPATEASPVLARAAIETAERWRFSPETVDGKPVKGYARVPVTFVLNPLPDKPAKTSPSAAS
ncbi:M56 family metallopeptidase [Rhodanobacter sp. DHG33]|uniref:M56 family metallopeptidase n=1 Tax=Rhodanobacter sp. DHG33 TaxID=2775921 RepID=UPI00177F6152|nr:M56 family metallopeptidase [Rhodanobacter sp. DHG33]MBD8900140.1 TonB family protein [Rhodanobacter sp. DHG33]